MQLLHINFFTDVFGITLKGTSLKSPFHSIFSFAGNHFVVFSGSLSALFLYFSRAIPCYKILYS